MKAPLGLTNKKWATARIWPGNDPTRLPFDIHRCYLILPRIHLRTADEEMQHAIDQGTGQHACQVGSNINPLWGPASTHVIIRNKSFFSPKTLVRICFSSLDNEIIHLDSLDSRNSSHNLSERFEAHMAAVFIPFYVYFYQIFKKIIINHKKIIK